MPEFKTTTRQKISLVLIGLLAGIVLLEIGLRAAGGIFLYYQERANIASLEEKGDFVILCLGESTTFNMYPRQLEIVLNERIDDLKISVIDKGVPGIHTTHILARLEGYLDAYSPDLVIAMIGVNDRGNTEVFVRPPGDDRPVAEIRRREECPGKSLADLRVYKLAQLISQQLRHTFTSIDHRSNFIREHDISAVPEDPVASVQEPVGFGVEGPSAKQDSAYFLRLGDEYSDNEETEKALAAYQEAAARQPENVVLLRDLAERIRTLEAYPEAEAVYRQILEVKPRDYLAYVELGMLANEQGKADDARGLFAEARKAQPALTRELHRIGRHYRDRGNDRMMEKYCLMAVAPTPATIPPTRNWAFSTSG
jgi:tetratricopeptide (TPR) repeat protein